MQDDGRLGRAEWWRVAAAWGALALLMPANGILRELVIRPRVGETTAGVLSAMIGIVLILGATRLLLPPLRRASARSLCAVSGMLLVLTVVFETALGLWVDGRSWRELLEHYALWRGELWPIVLAVLVLTPFLWGRWFPRSGPASRA